MGETTKIECHILIKCVGTCQQKPFQFHKEIYKKISRKREPFKQFILKWCGWGFAGYDAFKTNENCVEQFECIFI